MQLKIATVNVDGLRVDSSTGRHTSAVQARVLAERIRAIRADIVTLQGLDGASTLEQFRADDGGLAEAYPFGAAFPSNGDGSAPGALGILSRLPLGPITTWQHARSTDDSAVPLFRRNTIEVHIVDNGVAILVLYIVHMPDAMVDQQPANELADSRGREAAALADIIAARASRRTALAVLGTFGTDPHASELEPLIQAATVPLVDGLAHARELPEYQATPRPASQRWTVRPPGDPSGYGCWNHIWISPNLGRRLIEAGIARRSNPRGDGTRYDPAWVTLDVSGAPNTDQMREHRLPVGSTQRERISSGDRTSRVGRGISRNPGRPRPRAAMGDSGRADLVTPDGGPVAARVARARPTTVSV
ncbi:MAG: endonuclease/exonuclease/phosphatase family protein [Actinomycetota bacterium]|nr:endonuclease/exonuclease/phosphatase family protein [Actinomycetota bacterium]